MLLPTTCDLNVNLAVVFKCDGHCLVRALSSRSQILIITSYPLDGETHPCIGTPTDDFDRESRLLIEDSCLIKVEDANFETGQTG